MKYKNGTYYVWLGGSCDYGHMERAGAGAYIAKLGGAEVGRHVESAFGTTEFRMILMVMARFLSTVPTGSSIVFMTNVAYLQNFDREPTDTSANADLIRECIGLVGLHSSVTVKVVSYHRFPLLHEVHTMAHSAMCERRRG